jgi:K(+)-stimulated pyrophosphate-energized sodium pump
MAPILGSGSHTIADNATCITTGACTSMSEECLAKGCTNMACEHMKGVTLCMMLLNK